jgi:hypothetical protein
MHYISVNNWTIGPIFHTDNYYSLIDILPSYRAELTARHIPEAPFITVANSEEVKFLYLHQ